MIDERDLDKVWEPWKPKVGQRVRVRLSGECACYTPRTQVGMRIDGQTGMVVDGTVELIAGHNHWVQLDAYWWYPNWPGGTLPIGFAAIELEPIEEEQS